MTDGRARKTHEETERIPESTVLTITVDYLHLQLETFEVKGKESDCHYL